MRKDVSGSVACTTAVFGSDPSGLGNKNACYCSPGLENSGAVLILNGVSPGIFLVSTKLKCKKNERVNDASEQLKRDISGDPLDFIDESINFFYFS